MYCQYCKCTYLHDNRIYLELVWKFHCYFFQLNYLGTYKLNVPFYNFYTNCDRKCAVWQYDQGDEKKLQREIKYSNQFHQCVCLSITNKVRAPDRFHFVLPLSMCLVLYSHDFFLVCLEIKHFWNTPTARHGIKKKSLQIYYANTHFVNSTG